MPLPYIDQPLAAGQFGPFKGLSGRRLPAGLQTEVAVFGGQGDAQIDQFDRRLEAMAETPLVGGMEVFERLVYRAVGDIQRITLAPIAHVEAEVAGYRGGFHALFHQLGAALRGERLQTAGQLRIGLLLDESRHGVQKLAPARRRQHAQGGQHAGVHRHQRLANTQCLSERADVQAAGTAECGERKTAGIDTLLHRDHTQRLGHVLVGDLDNPEGRLLGCQPQLPGDPPHRLPRRAQIQLHFPAQKRRRAQTTQHQIGIGHRRQAAAPAIAGRPRIGPGAVGSIVSNLKLGVVALNWSQAVQSSSSSQAIACHYSNLEYDLETGKRGSRYDAVAALLCEITGAEAGLVVNNCAAAVLLTLDTLARDREVIVSRGELVEIGGSFRVPDIMAKSGARLREVGTTNRTHRRDYAKAIGEQTAMLLKVHQSNFTISGFTKAVGLDELVALGREHRLPVVEDLGSGTLVELPGLPSEAFAPARLRQGADLVCFSGDKLVGGPQAGLIVGSTEWVAPLAKHPLYRALRPDKTALTLMDEVERLPVAGKIIWITPVGAEGNRAAGIGVQFSETNPYLRKLVEEFLQTVVNQ